VGVTGVEQRTTALERTFRNFLRCESISADSGDDSQPHSPCNSPGVRGTNDVAALASRTPHASAAKEETTQTTTAAGAGGKDVRGKSMSAIRAFAVGATSAGHAHASQAASVSPPSAHSSAAAPSSARSRTHTVSWGNLQPPLGAGSDGWAGEGHQKHGDAAVRGGSGAVTSMGPGAAASITGGKGRAEELRRAGHGERRSSVSSSVSSSGSMTPVSKIKMSANFAWLLGGVAASVPSNVANNICHAAGREAGEALVGAANLSVYPQSEPRPCKDAHRCVTVSMSYRVSFAFRCYLGCRTLSARAACGIPSTPCACSWRLRSAWR